MNVYSEIEFPPLDACLNSPYHTNSNASTPSASLNSSLNPSAHVFTPRSSLIFNDCLKTSTPEQVPQIHVQLVGDEAMISASGDGPLSENKSQNLSKSRLKNNKVYGAGRKTFGNKRRLSMTSITNMSVSSVDTNVPDAFENENDPEVLARREKNINYGKNSDTYEKYIDVLPKQRRDTCSPRTPIKEMKYSRRQWDGLIKHWKINLHDWERGTNGTPNKPTFSTPKRPKIRCDRRSMGNATLTTPDRTHVNMLPPSITMMFSKENDEETREVKGEEKLNDILDWGQRTGTERIMDWSKECETSEDETEQDESVVNEQLDTESKDVQLSLQKNDSSSIQNDLEIIQSSPKHGTTINSDDKSLKQAEDEGTVFKCVSLVDAIAAFDDETYNEDDDEDYVPPEERGIILQELGLDASDEDSDPETLFYQVVQRQPFRLRKN